MFEEGYAGEEQEMQAVRIFLMGPAITNQSSGWL